MRAPEQHCRATLMARTVRLNLFQACRRLTIRILSPSPSLPQPPCFVHCHSAPRAASPYPQIEKLHFGIRRRKDTRSKLVTGFLPLCSPMGSSCWCPRICLWEFPLQLLLHFLGIGHRLGRGVRVALTQRSQNLALRIGTVEHPCGWIVLLLTFASPGSSGCALHA